MQLVKEDRYTEISGDKKLSRIEDVIDHMINYYQSTFIPREDWLTKQERGFFVASVIISNRGLQYTSIEAKRVYKQMFNLRRQSDVRGYLVDLADKGFLESDTTTKLISVVEFFKLNLNEQQIVVNVTLNYSNG